MSINTLPGISLHNNCRRINRSKFGHPDIIKCHPKQMSICFKEKSICVALTAFCSHFFDEYDVASKDANL